MHCKLDTSIVQMTNKGANTLSRRHLLLSILETKVLGFDIMKGMYAKDEDFK